MSLTSNEISKRLKEALPSALGRDVERILGHLQNGQNDLDLSPDSFSVKVDNESLAIPQRLYFKEINPVVRLTFTKAQKEILDCLYTRHHDGHIREKSLKNIIRSKNTWVVPYVFKLIGEYVVEIVQIVFQNLDFLDAEIYKTFIKTNPEFYEANKQRVISYWDCYYRTEKPNKADYVGFKILNHFDGLL